MPTLLKIENYPDLNTKDSMQLNAQAASGQAVIVVDGQSVLANNDFVYIGRVGQASLDPVEKCKVQSIASLPSVTLNANLTKTHPAYSPVKAVWGDQIQVYRAANLTGVAPADASFSTLGSPVDIDPGQVETEYIDNTGSNAFWYKYRYYNSASATFVSNLSDVDAIRGLEYGNYTTIAAIRKEAGITNNPYITDGYVREVRREAEGVINNLIGGKYTTPLVAPIDPLIERATKVLAAGYILKREFGQGNLGNQDKGQAKIDEVLGTKDKPGMLAGVLSGDSDITDGSGNMVGSNERISGWPNGTTATTRTEDGGSKRRFRMGRRY